MADDVIDIKIKVNSETGQLEIVNQQLAKAGNAAAGAEKSFLGLTGTAGELAKTYLSFVSVEKFVGFLKSSVEAAEQENEALRRLSSALESNSISWAEAQKEVKAFGDEIERTTRFADDEAFAALDKMVRVTGDLAQAQAAVTLSMDYAVRTGKDLSETQSLVIDLINGNSRALVQARRDFGSFLDGVNDTRQALGLLQQNLKGSAEAEESFTKASRELYKEIDKQKELIGGKLIPVLTDLFKAILPIEEGFEKLQAIVSGFEVALIKPDEIKHIFNAVREEIAEINQEYDKLRNGSGQKLELPEIKGKPPKNEVQDFNKAAEEKREIESKLAVDIARINQGKIASLKLNLQREVEEYRRKGVAKNLIAEYTAAKEKEIDKEASESTIAKMKQEVDQKEELSKNSHALMVKRLQELQGVSKDTAERMAAGYETVANSLASGVGGAFAESIVRGKDFGQAMEQVFLRLIELIIQTIIQQTILKSLMGPTGFFLAPSAGIGGGFAALGAGAVRGGGAFGAPAAGESQPQNQNINISLSTNNFDLSTADLVATKIAEKVLAKTTAGSRFSRIVFNSSRQNSNRAV